MTDRKNGYFLTLTKVSDFESLRILGKSDQKQPLNPLLLYLIPWWIDIGWNEGRLRRLGFLEGGFF